MASGAATSSPHCLLHVGWLASLRPFSFFSFVRSCVVLADRRARDVLRRAKSHPALPPAFLLSFSLSSLFSLGLRRRRRRRLEMSYRGGRCGSASQWWRRRRWRRKWHGRDGSSITFSPVFLHPSYDLVLYSIESVHCHFICMRESEKADERVKEVTVQGRMAMLILYGAQRGGRWRRRR
jgi:hypothetical protein